VAEAPCETRGRGERCTSPGVIRASRPARAHQPALLYARIFHSTSPGLVPILGLADRRPSMRSLASSFHQPRARRRLPTRVLRSDNIDRGEPPMIRSSLLASATLALVCAACSDGGGGGNGGANPVPALFNVIAQQQLDAARLVEVHYDLALNAVPPAEVRLSISMDGGITFPVQASSVFGDIGVFRVSRARASSRASSRTTSTTETRRASA
jgi:hypothetical protein